MPQKHVGVIDWHKDEQARLLIARADEFASNISKGSSSSSTSSWNISSLCDHMSRSINSQYLKQVERSIYLVRCAARWIFNNVQYDREGEENGDYSANLSRVACANNSIQNRKTGRKGFSILLHVLLEKMDIPTVIIAGWMDDVTPSEGGSTQKSGATTHSWNAVCIDSYWYLVDLFGAVWRSRSLDAVSPYFMSRPEEFVLDHYPEQENWQLLNRPLSLDEYRRKATFEKEFSELGFKLTDQRFSKYHLTCTNHISIPFGVLPEAIEGAIVIGELTDGKNHSLPEWLEGTNLVMFRKDLKRKQVILECTLPFVGNFHLSVLGGNKNANGGFYFHKIVSYEIESTLPLDCHEENLEHYCVGYPRMFRSFDPNLDILLEPSIACIEFLSPIDFRLWSARAEQLILVNDKDWYEFQREASSDGSLFYLSLPDGLMPASTKIYANQSSSSMYVPILEYTVNHLQMQKRDRVQMSSNCFKHGINIEQISAQGNMGTVSFRSRSEMDITCNLIILEEGGETYIPEEYMTMEREEESIVIRITFPRPGVYIFDCIGKTLTSSLFPLFTCTLECKAQQETRG